MNKVEISWYKIIQSLKNKPQPPNLYYTKKISNIIQPRYKIKISPKKKASQKKKMFSKRTFICSRCNKKLILQVKKGTNVTQCPICYSPALSL